MLLAPRVVFAWLAVLSVSAEVYAADPPTLRRPIFEGECRVVVLGEWSGSLAIDGVAILPERVDRSGNEAVIRLKEPLRRGELLTVPGAQPEVRELVHPALQPGARSDCQSAPRSEDERSGLSSTFSVGALSETFSPQKRALQQLNGSTDVADSVRGFSRADAVGTQFDVNYRLPISGTKARPIRLIVRAFYGRRTGICELSEEGCAAIPSADQALINVRRADTAEIYYGGRWEFAALAEDTKFPSMLYGTCVFGGIFIEGVGDKAISNHICGGGISWIGGRYRESYLEGGIGKSELFAPDQSTWDRKKVELFFTARVVNRDVRNGVGNFLNSFRPYFKVSLDRGEGPDSYQTNFGFTFDFVNVFGTPF